MAIVLDAMGSDQHPGPEVEAALQLAKTPGEPVILVGNEEAIRQKLSALNAQSANLRIVHAPDVLEMGDKVVESARKKPNNSMAVGMDLIKRGEARAFVTAGSTGAAMFMALRTLGRIAGVQRPALTGLFPVQGGRCVVCDIGANAECRPEFLLQFGILGSLYAEQMLNKRSPRVGLLSNGEEAGKGNTLIKETYPLLAASGLNFIGNVESKEVFGGQVDVVVTDGFTGNILLKTSESVAKFITGQLKNQLMASTRTKIGGLLAKPAFEYLRKLMDPGEVGAAPLLGIDGLVFVGHGRSDARSLVNAVQVARQAVELNLIEQMRQSIADKMNQLNPSAEG